MYRIDTAAWGSVAANGTGFDIGGWRRDTVRARATCGGRHNRSWQ
jgi:hypothetical protein